MSRKAIVPLLLSVSMAMGLVLGFGLSGGEESNRRPEWEKINQILQYVEQDYVDTISRAKLEDEAISYLLQRLDPHSFYIKEDKLGSINESLNGGFDGIGIQFNFQTDTVYVIKAIPGGPAEAAGLKAGDRLLKANGEVIAGVGKSNEDVMALLKGESGTEVSVTVLRNGAEMSFDVVRGTIALSSVDAAYMLNDTTIYLKLDRFAKNTFDEFNEAIAPFLTQNPTSIVLDLRGNGGGFLDAAVSIADEFLKADLVITYTEGKSRPRTEYMSTSTGSLENLDLSIIVDGYSASASEILAGAMQDHGRAVVYGKRSYGKGLVQEQNEWADGSATRLTVARYYTPVGRSIQRSYDGFSEDLDSLETEKRGGIVPDIEVDRDTAGITWLYAELVHRGWINEFVYEFRDAHLLEDELTFQGFEAEVSDSSILVGMREFLGAKAFAINESEWSRSQAKMSVRLRALLARSLFTDLEYYMITNRADPAVQRIIEAKKNRDV